MTQLSLIEGLPLGRQKRDEGHQRVRMAALFDPVKRQIDLAIRERARSGAAFTTDDVREMVGDIARPNLVGAAITAAAKAGLIEHAGYYVQSERPEARGRRLAVWRGVRRAVSA